MTIPTHDHSIPPYVHNLVVEAGRDNVFWASARDPGERPDTGASMSEWRNRVVGSGLEATQSTASDQPIWRGNRLEFAGDDFFNNGSADPGATSDWIAFFVWDRIAGRDSMTLGFWEDPSGQPRVFLLSNSDFSIRTKVTGDSGNIANPAIATLNLDLTEIAVTAHRIDWATGTVDVWARGSDRLFHDQASGSLSRAQTQEGFIGASTLGGLRLEGSLYEAIIAQADLTTAKIESIIDRLVTKWGGA